MLSRRIVLTSLAAALLAGCQMTARTASPVAIGEIRIDTSPLAAKGQSVTATLIKPRLERELASLRTADDRRGAVLQVTVTGLHLTSYAGGQAVTLGNDTLESEARLIGADGREIARYPILAIMAPSYGGAWYRPDADQRRIEALVASNAQWIRRAVGN
ncbi:MULTISPECIES: hypothetical protein [unclassified Bosea (in: a-proteobacteria)]|uniref:hypothetical protein n=1 Tax=unclassified Bosea (in: a-proteobacteria) TaxID=2653178 RepID=UPI000F7569B2|nr:MULTISPECIES: hypothetical protein [unclassified Bosea (in: a-proteobacteria)]AZO76267.1 hypothetical protein BLM15_00655 [Bosea sp. Tri-49]RXT26195.1 hypothetical protein B5U98_06565 [Bosea sp. Tri-39]RXT31437.1 hypothetical protein B5U99_22110 [Bosea sp. Tri-54]